MKLVQIGQCCSWKTKDGRFQIDYWANANRPRRLDGSDGGYGMYSVLDNGTSIGEFTSKVAAKTALAKAEATNGTGPPGSRAAKRRIGD